MPKIDTNAIENFETMTAEEKVTALTEFEYEAADASRIEFLESEVKRFKDSNSKALSNVSKLTKENRALVEKQTETTQPVDPAVAALQAEVQMLRAENTKTSIKAQLLTQGYTEDLAMEAAGHLADGNHIEFLATQKSFLNQMKNDIAKDLTNNVSKPTGTGAPQGMTKEMFSALTFAQRAALYNTDRATYEKYRSCPDD